MVDEIYDVIDREGNKIRTATWTECHSQGLLHQGVSILVFRDEKKEGTLLQRRGLNMVQEPGKWQCAAAGHLISGFTPKEGAIKELREELFSGHELPKGIEINEVGTFFSHDLPNNFEIIHIFETIYPGPFFYDNDELAEDPIWINWKELLNNIKVNPEKYAKFSIDLIKEYYKIINLAV